jgi:microcystin-dependent protein
MFLACFESNGAFSWATRAASNSDVRDNSIVADKDGHVYLIGTYESLLYIYDANNNESPVATLTKASNQDGDDDIFIIKYNRYGLLNTQNHRLLYIEDNAALPDSFCKQIIITDNDNDGIVNLNILKKGTYGYNVRRTAIVSEAIELVTKAGKWIPKLQTDQISIGTYTDVIDANTKLSIVDYETLTSSSWTTKIGGSGDEQNARMSSDSNNNVYVVGTYTTNPVMFYDLTTSGSSSQLDLSGSNDVFIAKYSPQGTLSWTTHIQTSISDNTPTIFTDAEGNSYVSIVTSNSSNGQTVNMYHTRDANVVASVVLPSNNTSITVKYDKDGFYQWHVLLAGSSTTFGMRDTNSVADANGNVYVAGYYVDTGFTIRDSSGDLTATITSGTSGLAIVKFNKNGTYLWGTKIYGTLQSGNKSSISCNVDGEIIVSGIYTANVFVDNIVDGTNVSTGVTISLPTGNSALFIVKYDATGKYIWNTRISSTNNVGANGNSVQVVSCMDASGNFYVATQIYGDQFWLYDTRDADTARQTLNLPTQNVYNTLVVKYSTTGIIQWYNYVSGFSGRPAIVVDNRFVKGINNNAVYLSGTYTGADLGDEVNEIRIYNAVTDGNPFDGPGYDLVNIGNNDVFVAKFDNAGQYDWASRVGGSSNDTNSTIVATRDGHVYLAGEFTGASINVYQGFTLGMNSNTDIAASISNTNAGTYDIFLVKFNRYGTINNGGGRFGHELYIENNSNLPDGTEKSIVVINNGIYNGIAENICLLILEYDNPGWTSFKTLWISEAITLVSYGGKWYIKSSASGDTLPKRSIVMWGGDQNDIPNGYRLCDGGSLNGVTTPDLRGRFVLGFNDGAAGVNGSSTNGGNTTTGTGARTSTDLSGAVGRTGGEVLHQLTVNEMPAHTHPYEDTYRTGNQGTDNIAGTETAANETSTNANKTTGSTGGDASHNNIPPYYVLAYIMKCY